MPLSANAQAYMMTATSSPLYSIIASNDIATVIMDRDGYRLVKEASPGWPSNLVLARPSRS